MLEAPLAAQRIEADYEQNLLMMNDDDRAQLDDFDLTRREDFDTVLANGTAARLTS